MLTAPSAQIRRKRCLNCNNFFTPKRNVVKKAKFCKDACRKEFWKHGSSFGPIKVGLYAAIDKKYVALAKDLAQRLKGLMGDIQHLMSKQHQLTMEVRALQGRPTVEVPQADARSR